MPMFSYPQISETLAYSLVLDFSRAKRIAEHRPLVLILDATSRKAELSIVVVTEDTIVVAVQSS
jgi:hypothetical protein